MNKRSLLFLLLSLFAGAMNAQTTGSFNVNIPFLSAQRQLAIYVPTTYNPANKYKLMICLHGLGDNAPNYRSALTSSLNWSTAYPQTIFVCPEASATTSDYFFPAGNEAIIPASIDYAMSNYHIDTADVVLQGFSLGGRAALRYGLDHPTTFKGLLLNTPALQGVKQALNLTPDYTFNFTNAAGINIFISQGATDVTYQGAIDTTYEQLVRNNAKVKYTIVPGMGHMIPNTTQMDFYDHFNDPGNAAYDADIVKIELPKRTCTAAINPKVLIRNAGKNALTSVKLNYVMGAVTGDYTWTGNLTPYQSTIVTLPVMNAATGSNNLTVSVAQLNGSLNDTYTANNVGTKSIDYVSFGLGLPINEGFEGNTYPPANWIIHETGEFYSAYYRDDIVKKTGIASMGAFNTILIFDNARRAEDLLSPVLDLTSLATPRVSFDVAYRHHRYTAPYFTPDTNFADTLEVLISTDCGNTFQSLYKKGGEQLATFATPIINPLQVEACFAEPADSNWRRESIDLTSYRTNNKAVIMFRYISALGGSLNMDNVSFSNSAVGVSHTSLVGMKVYPNPAANVVNVVAGNEGIQRVEILDISGRSVKLHEAMVNAGTATSIDVSGLPTGVYLLKAYGEKGIRVERISVSR